MSEQKAVLVTGGAGFIGSNYIHYYLEHYRNRHLVNLDKLTYAGDLDRLVSTSDLDTYHFVHGDITDKECVERVFTQFDIEGVIHFAAESHVDNSIADATPFIRTNVLGTGNLLEAARKDWQEKGVLKERRFHHISTDEVYGSLGKTGKFSEDTPYDPRNPYSATKAGANMLVKSYYTTYGMNVVLSSSSNNYGPRQHKEKLIPTIIRKALACEPIPIYGDGQNVRDWLFVNDHCRAIDAIFHHGRNGESYNVGGGNEYANLSLAQMICGLLDEKAPRLLGDENLRQFSDLLTFIEDRPGHDLRYAVDDSKIRRELGWQPEQSFAEGMEATIDWFLSRQDEVLMK